MLQLKLLDPDEKVRATVCKVYSQLDYDTALHYVSEAQLRAVAGRGMDKKHPVRVEAMNALGKLYSLAYPEMYVLFSRACSRLMHLHPARTVTRPRSDNSRGFLMKSCTSPT